MDNAISNNIKRQVAREANLLKKHATKEELDRIDFFTLNPFSKLNCIYGQMTGDCYGKRATSLIKNCAVPVASSISKSSASTFLLPVKNWVKKAWHTVSDKRKVVDGRFSAIEYYIALPDANIIGLTNYLQGRSEVLDL